MFTVKPDDDEWFDNLDPVLKVYMYEHWVLDQKEDYDKLRGLAILEGSFVNPDAAKKMIKSETPDYESSDEEFLESMRMVRQDAEREKAEKALPPRRRPRRVATVIRKDKVDG
jgi:hypothetical protein